MVRSGSFAHGRTAYELKHNAATVAMAIEGADAPDAADLLVGLVTTADLSPTEEGTLKALAADRAKVGVRAIGQRIKTARKEQASNRANETRQCREAARTDRRLRLFSPHPTVERLPILAAIDDVLLCDASDTPPARSAEGAPIEPRSRHPILLHDFVADSPDEGNDQ